MIGVFGRYSPVTKLNSGLPMVSTDVFSEEILPYGPHRGYGLFLNYFFAARGGLANASNAIFNLYEDVTLAGSAQIGDPLHLKVALAKIDFLDVIIFDSRVAASNFHNTLIVFPRWRRDVDVCYLEG